jgi:hypothetical protein
MQQSLQHVSIQTNSNPTSCWDFLINMFTGTVPRAFNLKVNIHNLLADKRLVFRDMFVGRNQLFAGLCTGCRQLKKDLL